MPHISGIDLNKFGNMLITLSTLSFLVCPLAAADDAAKKGTGGAKMKLSSPEFENNGLIPKKYTCDGDEINPPLVIENIPKDAKSLALIVDDPDAPGGMWVHWVVYDIPVTGRIEANSIPGVQGANDSNPRNYGGPCPPSGTHRYVFKIYALDKKLGLKEGARKEELEKAMAAHILDKAEVIGLYRRK